MPKDVAGVLVEFEPQHAFFVGIDSDGCVFGAMEIKHKECFIPNTIRYWELQAVAAVARETAEFVNLYSAWRGQNRWVALVKMFELLSERPEVHARGAHVPRGEELQKFIGSGYPLSDDGLLAYAALHPHPEFDRALAWSCAVNETIAHTVQGVPPFPWVRESLDRMQDRVDMIVVSATPVEALEREWAEHDLDRYVSVIAGQELGSKAQHLQVAAQGKYPSDHILLIGDAPGDLAAARALDVLFYPIRPSDEAGSWQRFHDEALDRFLGGAYRGAYEDALVAEFEQLLPETPPWQA